MKQIVSLIIFLFSFSSFAQIEGQVVNMENTSPIEGATIYIDKRKESVTDAEGKFLVNRSVFPCTLIVTKDLFLSDTLILTNSNPIKIFLESNTKTFDAVVVSAGRRQQKVEEVSISLEIIKPQLINNKGITDLEQAVDQSPGVYAMDGQVSIRGGGGYSYGAGSRVLLLWNGIPMTSPDVGDVKWNSIPMENASQIEVIKGASSVLYGSGALNGIISLSEKDPSADGELSAKAMYGIYGNPRRESLKWWTVNPMFYTADVFYGKSFKQVGYTLSVNGFKSDGYRKGELENRARLGGSFYYRPTKFDRLKLGAFFNAQYQYTGGFILWESDSLGYIAQGGMDPTGPGSTLFYQKSLRLNVDPYVKYFDKNNNKHELKTRYYLVSTGDLTNIYASSKAEMYYANYQFQKQWKEGSTLSAGTTLNQNKILSAAFGNHNTTNAALYGQFEWKKDKWDVTLGTRMEYFELDGKQGDSYFYLNKDSSAVLPIYPIFRSGIHYELNKATHLRTSFGQGIRFPSVAERYAATSSGGVIIFPNPDLAPEIGWAAELGVKQIVKLGEWKGYLDLAGFINQYSNMIEYTFGVYNPDSVVVTPSNLTNWVGFKAKNAEKARITGVELSFNSAGKIKEVEVISLVGYTYMNPISLNTSKDYVLMFSDTTSNMLKYRFRHLAKADVEVNYKKYSAGISCRYNSFMRNIDRVFIEDLNPTNEELYVLPGLREYREKYDQGSLVFDARFGYNVKDYLRLGFIVNNILNAEYVSRPADIQAPRTFMLQLQYKI
jgi:outer membrane receptor protein involved in Fe transport